MFAPLVTTTGEIVFVAPAQIETLEEGPTLPEESGLAPDGKPWPTTMLHLMSGRTLTVKGTPVMILNAWFGPQQTPDRSPIVTVPPGTRIKN